MKPLRCWTTLINKNKVFISTDSAGYVRRGKGEGMSPRGAALWSWTINICPGLLEGNQCWAAGKGGRHLCGVSWTIICHLHGVSRAFSRDLCEVSQTFSCHFCGVIRTYSWYLVIIKTAKVRSWISYISLIFTSVPHWETFDFRWSLVSDHI